MVEASSFAQHLTYCPIHDFHKRILKNVSIDVGQGSELLSKVALCSILVMCCLMALLFIVDCMEVSGPMRYST